MEKPDILIVDDSSVIRRGLVRQLEAFGARVTQAKDGQEGYEIAVANGFDLIISDIDMPRLDGFGLCKKLKDTERTRGTPVIILSSRDGDKDIDRGFDVGAAAYVSKAEARDNLQGTIERVLEKASFQKERLILAVDDSPIIRKIVEKGLGQAGFQVVTAEDGKDALKQIHNRRPDLILCDIEMPEMNGIELCERVHANPRLATIPFVIMSSLGDRAVMRRMFQRGATAYLVKPFNVDQLVTTVERLLSDQFLLLLKDRDRLDSERRLILSSITSLTVALEARDQYTRGHSEAVSMLISRMAAEMNTTHEELENLGIGGRLHDLGKIGVPDRVLLKEGPLTKEEFSVIMEHPVIGANILKSIQSLSNVIPVILHHHERIDGKGYPDGLKGDQIPIWARVTAVADTYHALTSDRPYRKGMPHAKALQIIEEAKGTQLCPECVALFLKIFSEE